MLAEKEIASSHSATLGKRVVSAVMFLPTRLLLLLIKLYQLTLSPLLGPCCRFEPSCSAYAAGALKKHGVFLGLAKSLWRVARCNPLCKGGYDPP